MKEGITSKDEIYNALLDDLRARECSFPEALIEDEGKYILQVRISIKCCLLSKTEDIV